MEKIESQQENIKNLLKLIEENPELEIVPMVSTECVPSDDHGYWMAKWSVAEIDEYYISDERIYFKSTDYDELVEDYECDMDENLHDNEAEQKAIDIVEKLKWVKAIVINIDAA